MAFHVYPDDAANPQNNPLCLMLNETGVIAFSEPAGLNNNDNMFIHIAMSDPTVPITAGAAPTLSLRAGTGDPVQINVGAADALIYNTPGENPLDLVAGANIVDNGAPNDVFLIDVTVFSVGSPWEVHILNNDSNPRDFVCVVADSESETEQPWLNVADGLDYDTLGQHLTGQDPVDLIVEVANKGTGSLTVDAGDIGVIGALDFEVLSVPGPLNPNSIGNLTIRFNSPATPGQSTVDYDITSNDTTAKSGIPGISHNRRVSISATTGQLELIMLLDASGSMAYQPNGDSSVIAETDSRWGKLKVAAKQFLDLLSDFGNGLGRFGVAMFPDITNIDVVAPVPVPSSADFQTPKDISDATIDSAKNALDDHTPKQASAATSMGHGIGRVIGTTPASFGYFNDDDDSMAFNPRWLVIMSDGKHNSSPPAPEDFYKTIEGDGTCNDVGNAPDGESFVDKKIKVISIAYGDDDVATVFEVDHAMLERLACKSDGVSLDAGADDAGLELLKEFRSAITNGLALDPTQDPAGFLTSSNPEARHQISVTEYDKKVSFVVNWATPHRNVDVQLLTPDCQLITPGVARDEPTIRFHDHPRYAIYTIEEGYLRDDNQNISRHGVWTLIISIDGLYLEEGEPYEYEVITESRLKLSLKLDRAHHYAGDPIHLTARLTLDGQPVPDASVYLHLTKPGQADANILGRATVTAEQLARASEALRDEVDATRLGIKRHALKLSQRSIIPITKFSPIAMPFADGAYTATITDTSTPEKYTFYVTVTGKTISGTFYRREKRLQVRVGVRPVVDFTRFDIVYSQIIEDNVPFRVADVRIIPQDRFGNLYLTEPDLDPTVIGLTVQGGRFREPLVSDLDGSYRCQVVHDLDASPVISLDIGGEKVTPSVTIVPTGKLTYVDKVIDFRLGAEGSPGANQHRNPIEALDDVTLNDRFVALGGLGVIVLGFEDKDLMIQSQGDDDVTVFMQPAQPLRNYQVEVMPADRDEWVELGRADVTASFSLRKVGLKQARAIRITDRSFHLTDSSGNAISDPGVSIRGVGFKLVKSRFHWLFEASIREVRDIRERAISALIEVDIDTLRELSTFKPRSGEVDISRSQLIDLRARALLALETADEFMAVAGLEEWSLWRVSEFSVQSLMEASGATEAVITRLCNQTSALRLALRQEFLERVTVVEMAQRTR